jgi:FMN phosphatase YigB (HAD superfamily)
MPKILYVDMDNVLVDFTSAFAALLMGRRKSR